jgi:hypothetical protein
MEVQYFHPFSGYFAYAITVQHPGIQIHIISMGCMLCDGGWSLEQ